MDFEGYKALNIMDTTAYIFCDSMRLHLWTRGKLERLKGRYITNSTGWCSASRVILKGMCSAATS